MKKRFGDLSIGDCFYSYGLYLYKVDAHNAITQQDRGNQRFLFSIHNLVLPVEELIPIDEMPKNGLRGNSVDTIILDEHSSIESISASQFWSSVLGEKKDNPDVIVAKEISLQLVDENILLWINGVELEPIEVNIMEEGFDILLPPMIIAGELNERFIIEQYDGRLSVFFESCSRGDTLTTEMPLNCWKKGIDIIIIAGCFIQLTTRITV